MELQNAVKESLNALYHHPEDMVRVQADRWLQDFQRTVDAWQTLLIKFHKAPPKVRTQIGIVIATLAVHVPAEEWGDGGIVNWLGEKMKSHPDYVPGFLELLTVLLEEVFNYKIAARSERRHQFEKELTAQMEIAFNILTSCLSINGLTEQIPFLLASLFGIIELSICKVAAITCSFESYYYLLSDTCIYNFSNLLSFLNTLAFHFLFKCIMNVFLSSIVY